MDNLLSRKRNLLSAIEDIKRERSSAELALFKAELARVTRQTKAARARMLQHEANGDSISAERSRSAYEYGLKYCDQLRHIIQGRQLRENGKVYFTKDARQRFIKRPET